MDSPSASQDSQLAAAFDDEFAAWEGGDADLDPNGNAEDDGIEELKEEDQAEPLQNDGLDEGDAEDEDIDAMADELLQQHEQNAGPSTSPDDSSQLAGDEGGPLGPPTKRRRLTAVRRGTHSADGSPLREDPISANTDGRERGASGSELAQPEAAACPHPTYWAGMCVRCGAPKPEADGGAGAAGIGPGSAAAAAAAGGGHSRGRPGQGAQGVPAAAAPAGGPTRIKHLHARGLMEVGAGEAERLRRVEVERLRGAGKLMLVLDLDHTLLNSVRLTDVSGEQTAKLEAILKVEEANPSRRSLFCLRDKNLWTKLRPGARELLEGCRSMYELHIYTMGDRAYAAEVRQLLDPERKLFSSVISQNDSTSNIAKDLDVALADDSLVLILDDTEQVWPRHKKNLIQVDRYHFFPASLRQWGSDASALLERGEDECAQRGTLGRCLQVLCDIHSKFYGHHSDGGEEEGASLPVERRDVRYFLQRRREQVLAGTSLIFSGCWPQNLATPYSHPLWLLAEGLGAECSTAYSARTTHVVAAAPGTAKALQAERDGKHVVGPEWLHACMFQWHRVSEAQYPARVKQRAGSSASAPARAKDDLKAALSAAGGGK